MSNAIPAMSIFLDMPNMTVSIELDTNVIWHRDIKSIQEYVVILTPVHEMTCAIVMILMKLIGYPVMCFKSTFLVLQGTNLKGKSWTLSSLFLK